jgi:hypothetical protein
MKPAPARLGIDRELRDPVLLLDALIAAHHVHHILAGGRGGQGGMGRPRRPRRGAERTANAPRRRP